MFDSTEKTIVQKTPKKIQRINGLITLSSSNKKKLSLKNVTNNRFINIDMYFDHGQIKRDSFSKFVINIFQYILYDKNAIPVPFDYLEKLHSFLHNQTNQTIRKNVLLETSTKLNLMFQFITELFRNSQIHFSSIALCLGDSMRFAQEIFLINFDKLNLNDGQENNKIPYLTLRYMIDSFYKRLLNEIPDEIPQQRTSCIKKNPRNVLFAVKTSPEHFNDLKICMETFVKNNPTVLGREKLILNVSNHAYRIGSVLSQTTKFIFDHRVPENVTNQSFDIYLEDEGIDEVIEEKIAFITEEKSPEFDNDIPENSVQIQSTNAPNHSQANSVLSNDDGKGSLWIQIGQPIPCVTQI